MRKRNMIAALVAAVFTLATTSLPAQEPGPAPLQPAPPGQDHKSGKEPLPDPAQRIQSGQDTKRSDLVEASAAPFCHRASHLIGLEVRTETGDVEKDVVTLKGKVAAAELQRKLDDQIKAIPGVDRLDEQLIIVAKTD